MIPNQTAACLLSIVSMLGADDTDEAKSAPQFAPPPAVTPGPGFVKLPGQYVPSDFPSPRFGLSVKTGNADRTKVRFKLPTDMDIQITTMDFEYGFAQGSYGALNLSNGLFSTTHWVRSWPGQSPETDETEDRDVFRRLHILPPPTVCSLLQGRNCRILMFDSEVTLCGTVEVPVQDGRNREISARSTISITLTEEDIKNVIALGNLVKIAYIPNANYENEETATDAGIQISTHPGWALNGIDPVQDARSRGQVLLVMRLGIGQICSSLLNSATPPPNSCYYRALDFVSEHRTPLRATS